MPLCGKWIHGFENQEGVWENLYGSQARDPGGLDWGRDCGTGEKRTS